MFRVQFPRSNIRKLKNCSTRAIFDFNSSKSVDKNDVMSNSVFWTHSCKVQRFDALTFVIFPQKTPRETHIHITHNHHITWYFVPLLVLVPWFKHVKWRQSDFLFSWCLLEQGGESLPACHFESRNNKEPEWMGSKEIKHDDNVVYFSEQNWSIWLYFWWQKAKRLLASLHKVWKMRKVRCTKKQCLLLMTMMMTTTLLVCGVRFW